MENKKISVIVPVYNAQKYLEECLNALINQTYKNLEIIVIDDGSTDNSYSICKTFKSKDNRIKLYKKKNTGVSDTRNYGLEKVSGDYISFIDSDDYLELNAYETIMKTQENYDLITFNFKKIYKNYTELSGIKEPKKINNEEAMKIALLIENSFCGYLWNKLFKSSIIKENNITFDKNISICEDLLFVLNYLEKCKNVLVRNDYLYNYRMRSSSLSKTFNIEKYCTIFNAYEKIINICKNKNIKERYIVEYEYIFNYYLYKKKIIHNSIHINLDIISEYKNLMKSKNISNKQKRDLFIVKNFNFYYRVKTKLKNKILIKFIKANEMFE